MALAERIELPFAASKAVVLPLNDARNIILALIIVRHFKVRKEGFPPPRRYYTFSNRNSLTVTVFAAFEVPKVNAGMNCRLVTDKLATLVVAAAPV